MNDDNINKLHADYRTAFVAYTAAESVVIKQGEIANKIGFAMSSATDRKKVWEVFSSDEARTANTKGLAEAAHNMPTTEDVHNSITEWYKTASQLIAAHNALSAAGEAESAKSFPNQLKGGV